jgi:hypothetical protein
MKGMAFWTCHRFVSQIAILKILKANETLEVKNQRPGHGALIFYRMVHDFCIHFQKNIGDSPWQNRFRT